MAEYIHPIPREQKNYDGVLTDLAGPSHKHIRMVRSFMHRRYKTGYSGWRWYKRSGEIAEIAMLLAKLMTFNRHPLRLFRQAWDEVRRPFTHVVEKERARLISKRDMELQLAANALAMAERTERQLITLQSQVRHYGTVDRVDA